MHIISNIPKRALRDYMNRILGAIKLKKLTLITANINPFDKQFILSVNMSLHKQRDNFSDQQR